MIKRIIIASLGLMACRETVVPSQTRFADDSIFATGLYQDQTSLSLADNILPYKPSYELWSDGADKTRYAYLPPSTSINNNDANFWEYPVGTKLWKEFSFAGKRVETRLMEKTSEGNNHYAWTFSTYQWNPEQTDAHLASSDGIADVAQTPFETTHDIPSQRDCLTCHQTGSEPVLGFSALQLAGPGEGIRATDLAEKAMLTQTTPVEYKLEGAEQADLDVLGYLHANCSNCHNTEARAGRMTGLIYKHDFNITNYTEAPGYKTSVNALTKYYLVPGQSLGVDSFNIMPGEPEKSAVYVRMSSREKSLQMPPLASKVADRQALDALKAWIIRTH